MTSTLPTLAAVLLAVAVGSGLQRVSGMGVGLVVSPTLALLLGPVVGVSLTNATTVVSATVIGIGLRHRIAWRRFAVFAVAAPCGAAPAALLVRAVPGPWLSLLVGAVVLAALLITVVLARSGRLPERRGRASAVVAGVVGAFLNTVAGVAAPAMVVHAELSRWDQRSFAATMQATFAWFGLLSVVVKVGLGATPLSALPSPWILVAVVATVLGTVHLVGRVADRLDAARARRVATGVAGVGAVVTLVRGLAGLLG